MTRREPRTRAIPATARLCVPLAAALLGACAQLPTARNAECLEPNRRVVVEVGGSAQRAVAKPPAKGQAATSTPIRLIAGAQGASAFDAGSGALKETGRAELDRLITEIAKRRVRVGSVVIAGHTDRVEAATAPPTLSEERAKSVAAYLVAHGLDSRLMFWEGKGASDPLPATQFCE